MLCYRGNPFCGGQGIYIFNLSRELAALGHQVDVMTGPPYPEPMDEWASVYRLENLNTWSFKTRDIPYEKLKRIYSPWNFTDYLLTRFTIFPEMETFSMRAFYSLRKILRERSYDIIHDVNSIGWGLIPMKGFGIPIVTTIHHPLTRDRSADLTMDRTFWDKMTTILFYPLMMQRIVINRMNRVITSSYEGINELHRAFGVRKDRISVVYNGMDVNVFKNTGEKRDERHILFVGNTEDHKKGLIYLLEAVRDLPDDVRLTIVDDGPPVKWNGINLARRVGVEDRITFTGKVDFETLVSLYSRATILVMSSLYEGFGLPAVEAMACETPVVATTAGALAEVVDEKTGILVEPGDPDSLRDAITYLLDNRGLREEMGINGRKRAEELFSWPVAAKNTLGVYKEVIDEYRSRV